MWQQTRIARCNNSPEWVVLSLVWLLATVCNITKAVHIDDPVHLYAVEAILRDPFAPYSGPLLWGGYYLGQLKDITQPPLLFYQFAFVAMLTGFSITAFHLVIALYTALLIWGVYALARSHGSEHASLIAALVILGPACIPSQNLMTDIPLVSLIVLFFRLLLPGATGVLTTKRLIAAGVCLGVTCLTKYVGLFLFPILVIAVLRHRGRFAGIAIVLPLILFIAFSISNYFDYGGFHLLQPAAATLGKRWNEVSLDWLVCIGAIAPFSILFLPLFVRSTFGMLLLAGILGTGILFRPAHFSGGSGNEFGGMWFVYLFFVNGLLVSTGAFLSIYYGAFSANLSPDELRVRKVYYTLWLLGGYSIIALFAQGMAVRYVLPVLPVVVLLIPNHAYDVIGVAGRALMLAISTTLGVSVGLADWQLAEAYRQAAAHIRLSDARGTQWVVGQWGWQWYAQREGMKLYDWNTRFEEGDQLILPLDVPGVDIKPEHQPRLFKTREVHVSAIPSIPIRTMAADPIAGFYRSGGTVTPWRISTAPHARFQVFTVKEPGQEILLPPFVLSFSASSGSVAFVGFAEEESWGRWSSATNSRIVFQKLLPKQFLLKVTGFTLKHAVDVPVTIVVGSFHKTIYLTDSFSDIEIPIETNDHVRTIEINVPRLNTPTVGGGVGDTRRLGVAIHSLTLLPPASTHSTGQ